MTRARYFLLIVGLFGLFVISCTDDDSAFDLGPLYPVPNQPVDISYLALGDSYTIGHAVPADMNFPNQLAQSLESTGNWMVDSLLIVARTGWPTDALQSELARRSLEPGYDFVTLLIGVNNLYRGYPFFQFVMEFDQLLDEAIYYAGGRADRVVVVSIPDYAYTPFGQGNEEISKGIDMYNATKENITRNKGVAYVGITDISRQGLELPELVAQDGLHPSGEQYSRWVERLSPVVESMLR